MKIGGNKVKRLRKLILKISVKKNVKDFLTVSQRQFPFGLMHLFLDLQLLLTLPEFGSGMRVSGGIEWTDIFRNVHLILSYHHLGWELLFILEPGVGHTEIQITGNLDGIISPQEDFPMVVDGFKNGCEANIQSGEILKTEGVPIDFYFLTFRVGHYLPGNVDLVGEVEHIQPKGICEICVINLFEGCETELDNVFHFFSGDLNRQKCTPGTLLITSSTSIWQ